MLLNPKYSISLACVSISLLTGCNQSPTVPNPTKDKPASVSSSSVTTTSTTSTSTAGPMASSALSTSPATAQNTVETTDTAKALLTVMSGLMFKAFIQSPTQTLSAEQKSCLQQTNYEEFVPTFHRYLQSKLTADELTKANQYYALPVGQKQIQIASQQLMAVKGEKITNPVKLTDDEKLQMQAFQGTPEAQKLGQLLSPANQAEIEKVLGSPMMAKAVTDCHIEIKAQAQSTTASTNTKP